LPFCDLFHQGYALKLHRKVTHRFKLRHLGGNLTFMYHTHAYHPPFGGEIEQVMASHEQKF